MAILRISERNQTGGMSMNPGSINGPNSDHALAQDAGLRQRFVELWRRTAMQGASTDPEAIWHELVKHYAAPDRHYHTKQHLAFCLQQLDLAGKRIPHPARVEMAIWFHDVIYRSGQRDNEQRSAEWFGQRASGIIPDDFIDPVLRLIEATTHLDKVDGLDQQFICDIDLASFGCPWEQFVRNSEAVRAEYALPDEEFYRGEHRFLSTLLQRPRIFLTDFFHQLYEQQARSNITRFLDLIEQRRT